MFIKLKKVSCTISVMATLAVLAACGDSGEASGGAAGNAGIIETGGATGAAAGAVTEEPGSPVAGVPAATAPVAETTPPAPPVVTTIDTTDAAIVVAATKSGTSNGEAVTEFDFPQITPVAGGLSIAIPEGALPEFGARRTLINGTGASIEFGDAVVLKYDMFSWTNGALVESSSQLDGPYAVQAGVSDNIPEFLAKSLLGRKLGETMQVVFPVGMEDLPGYMDPNDAYVLVMELL